jgi:outer membrane protein TolC
MAPRAWARSGAKPKTRWIHVLLVAAAALAALAISASAAPGQEVPEEECEEEAERQTLSLVDAVGIALHQSRDIEDAELDLEIAQEQVRDAWSEVLPKLDGSAQYARNVKPAVSFLPANIFDPTAPEGQFTAIQFGADNAWNAGLNLTQPLFDARAFIGVGAAGRFELLQSEAVRGRSQSVVTRVRVAFYDVLLAQEQARLVDNSVNRVRESIAETQAMNRAGVSSDYDVLRLEVELANLEPNLRRARNAEAAARRRLAVELAMENLDELEVEGSLASMNIDDVQANDAANLEVLFFAGQPDAWQMAPEEAFQVADASRSDLRQLYLTEELRGAELKAEELEWLPKVNLFGTWSLSAAANGRPDFFGNPNARATALFAGVTLSVPIFTGFSRQATTDQKRAQLRKAQTQTRLIKDQAETQILDLMDQVAEARVRAFAQQRAVDQAQRGFEIAGAQYREGLGSQLERTDAEVALRQSEFNYAQAVYDFLVARAGLDEALGTVPLVDVAWQAPPTVQTDEDGDAEAEDAEPQYHDDDAGGEALNDER